MITQLAIQLVLQILLPVGFIIQLLRKKFSSRSVMLIEAGILGLFILFVCLTARWDTFSYYLRILIPLAYVIATVISYIKIDKETVSSASQPWLAYIVQFAVIAALIWLNANVLRGYAYTDEAVTLSYPLKDGLYYVGGGGNSRWVNNHNAFPPQTYALDIVRLNYLGNRAFGIAPEALEAYTIFGDTLYSPCTGEVIVAIDTLPDQTPPSKGELAGNHVVISCNGVDVLLAHMMKSSVTVKVGDEVEQGEVIGRVGNSGNTTQPHLHIHAERGGVASKILDGQGVPIKFKGRFLLRNDLFTGG